MKTFILILLLAAAPFLIAFDPEEEIINLYNYDGYDWNQWPEYERYAYAYGFMMSQFAMLADAGHHIDGQVGELIRYYSHYPDESPWSVATLMNEIYENPGFRDVPIAVAMQLRHTYVAAIRRGDRIPPRIERSR